MYAFKLAQIANNCIFVTHHNLENIKQQILIINPKKNVLTFPHHENLPYEQILHHPKVAGMRVRTLYKLSQDPNALILTTPAGFLEKFPPLKEMKPPITIAKDEKRYFLETFIEESGYHTRDIVRYPGDVALRGHIIDIFPTTLSHPVRFDFFGDDIEEIKIFDPVSQKSIRPIDKVTLWPAQEWKNGENRTETLMHLVPDAEMILDVSINLQAYIDRAFDIYSMRVSNISEKDDQCRVLLPPDTFMMTEVPRHKSLGPGDFSYHHYHPFKNIEEACAAISKEMKTKMVILGSLKAPKFFENLDIESVNQWPSKYTKGKIVNLNFPTEEGFSDKNFILFSENELLGKVYQVKKKKTVLQKHNFTMGDYVVHLNHGIGQFQGFEHVTINKNIHECIKILYANNEKLLVPIEQFNCISYYGSASDSLQLDQLGSFVWQRRKEKTKKRINDMCEELVRIAAARQLKTFPPIDSYTDAYEKFVNKFPYPETEDQIQSIHEIIEDLKSGRLMDRILCGDAGFGKTEVAMRAAFMMVQNGFQVAVMVPTTALSHQHYRNFKTRFSDYGVRQFSRMTKEKDQEVYRQELIEGKCHIAVGTTALISDRVQFKKLGLLIIDEEHHFGVRQKEKIKKAYQDIHVLSLSATPIPRSLHLSLSGIKDLSLLTTPPSNRTAISTHVGIFDPIIVQEALRAERKRGGQSFWIVPHIKTIDQAVWYAKQFLPDARIAVGHGQLTPEELERIMVGMSEGRYDLLIATTIIEAGLDLPRANTMIIQNAHLFGLAQLYQMRGRVGRSAVQAFAYITYPETASLTKEAIKRLEVMQNIDQLGIGFTIATQDMDIRGYGNIVGSEQSGHIKDIGVELYQELLEKTLEHIRHPERKEDDWEPEISLDRPIYIPESYVADADLRQDLYQRISVLTETQSIRLELEDRFGTMPSELENLLEVINLKNICKKAGITHIKEGPKGIAIKFREFPKSTKFKDLMDSDWAQKNISIRSDASIILTTNFEPKVITGFCMACA